MFEGVQRVSEGTGSIEGTESRIVPRTTSSYQNDGEKPSKLLFVHFAAANPGTRGTPDGQSNDQRQKDP